MGRWVYVSDDVAVYIPFQARSVSTGTNSATFQYLYNGKWYTAQNLLKVWNPIKRLPSWLR